MRHYKPELCLESKATDFHIIKVPHYRVKLWNRHLNKGINPAPSVDYRQRKRKINEHGPFEEHKKKIFLKMFLLFLKSVDLQKVDKKIYVKNSKQQSQMPIPRNWFFLMLQKWKFAIRLCRLTYFLRFLVFWVFL